MTLAQTLSDTAARRPDHPAVIEGRRRLTFRELDDLSSRVARRLQEHGIGPGDRVGLLLPALAAFPVLYHGILRAGGVVVPLNPLSRSREVAHIVGDAGATLVFVNGDLAAETHAGADELATVVEVGPGFLDEVGTWPADPAGVARADDDTAVILYTSGTTGTPKGAELTHANMGTNARLVTTDLAHLRPDDVIFGCLPLFHAFGQTCAMNAAVHAGVTLTLLPRFSADAAMEIIERDRVTLFEGVPATYIALLSASGVHRDTSSLRMCISSGSAIPREVLQRVEQRFGVPVLEGYGLSETSPTTTFNRPDAAREGSVGQPIPGVEVQVRDADDRPLPAGQPGEVVVRGHNVMRGYWRRPDATDTVMRGGWFHTGDIGRLDEDGFLFIVDRLKDMIIRNGYNVYPREIEEVLHEHPDVLEAAVVGVPHPRHGEEVVAAVVLRPGATAGAHDLVEHARQRVAAYKYPRRVVLVDRLPKGSTGKILKRDIVIPPLETAAD